MASSWKIAIGLFASVLGSLSFLVGGIFYTWGQLQTLYSLPVLAVLAISALLVFGGVVLIASERSDTVREHPRVP